jgi:hypothetical protein
VSALVEFRRDRLIRERREAEDARLAALVSLPLPAPAANDDTAEEVPADEAEAASSAPTRGDRSTE